MVDNELILAISKVIKAEIEPLTDEARKANERLDRLEEKTDRLQEQVNGLEVKMDRLQEQMDGLQKQVNALEAKTDRLQEQVDSLEAKTDRLQEQVDSLEAKTDRLQEQVDGLEAKTDEIKEDLRETQLYLENDIRTAINVIGDGHDFLKKDLDRALNMEKYRERMALQIFNLRGEVRSIKKWIKKNKKLQDVF